MKQITGEMEGRKDYKDLKVTVINKKEREDGQRIVKNKKTNVCRCVWGKG